MIDTLFQMGLSNACIAAGLAVLAMLAGWKAKRPQLAHMLWLLVLVKLVTPPIVSVPLFTIPQQAPEVLIVEEHVPTASGDATSPDAPRPIAATETFVIESPDPVSPAASVASAVFLQAKRWFSPIWLLGSTAVLLFSLVRVWRFGRLLAAETQPATDELRTAAVRIAQRLGMNAVPAIRTTSARLSPMVWWAGRRVQIIVPSALLEEMDEPEWRWILAHELAHVRRGDHLVRWLEWAACVVFWWNPIVWWARRNLRATEEICCDSLVLSSLRPKPQAYANSLLTAVEFLAAPVLRPPAMASEINSGGFLERRFRMIVSKTEHRAHSRWLKVGVVLCAVAVLPFGMAYATDYDAVAGRLGEAVKKGEISQEQAKIMMHALKRSSDKEEGDLDDRIESRVRSVMARLKAAVEKGDLSEKDALEKWQQVKEREIIPRIEKAVQAGRLAQQEAREIAQKIREAEVHERIRAVVTKSEMAKREVKKTLTLILDDLDEEEEGEHAKKVHTIEVHVQGDDKDGKPLEKKTEKRVIIVSPKTVEGHIGGYEKPLEAETEQRVIVVNPKMVQARAGKDGESLDTEAEKRVIVVHEAAVEDGKQKDKDARPRQARVLTARIDRPDKAGTVSELRAGKIILYIDAERADDGKGEEPENHHIRVERIGNTIRATAKAKASAVKRQIAQIRGNAVKADDEKDAEKSAKIAKQIVVVCKEPADDDEQTEEDERLESVMRRLGAAVDAGKMSPMEFWEEVWKRVKEEEKEKKDDD